MGDTSSVRASHRQGLSSPTRPCVASWEALSWERRMSRLRRRRGLVVVLIVMTHIPFGQSRAQDKARGPSDLENPTKARSESLSQGYVLTATLAWENLTWIRRP